MATLIFPHTQSMFWCRTDGKPYTEPTVSSGLAVHMVICRDFMFYMFCSEFKHVVDIGVIFMARDHITEVLVNYIRRLVVTGFLFTHFIYCATALTPSPIPTPIHMTTNHII